MANPACGYSGYYHSMYVDKPLIVGSIIYTTECEDERFNGQSLWWKVMGGVAAQIDPLGVVLAINDCTGENYSLTLLSDSVKTSYEDSCAVTTGSIQTLYKTTSGDISINDIIYSDSAATSTINGADKWYKMNLAGEDIINSYKINASGVVIAVSDCQVFKTVSMAAVGEVDIEDACEQTVFVTKYFIGGADYLSIGDTVYNSEDSSDEFNGSNLLWKINGKEYARKIDTDGVVIYEADNQCSGDNGFIRKEIADTGEAEAATACAANYDTNYVWHDTDNDILYSDEEGTLKFIGLHMWYKMNNDVVNVNNQGEIESTSSC